LIAPFARAAARERAGWPRLAAVAPATAALGCDASFGGPSRPGKSGYRARVRLYRSLGRDTVEPRPTSTLEAVVLLPVVEEEGIVDAHVVLRTADLGTPQGTLAAPIAALPGPAEGGLAGTRAKPYDRDCAAAPLPGEVCVRVGAFWMGDAALGSTCGNVASERLVVVSPFYLDATEVTVANLRASGIPKGGILIQHSAELPRSSYSAAPGELESQPLSCVTRGGAMGYCTEKGARLPSEAEWEFAASARRSAHTVWGDDPREDVVRAWPRERVRRAERPAHEPRADGAIRPVGARIDWASPLRRVDLEDVLAYTCGGRRQVLADLLERDVVVAILAPLELSSEAPQIARARSPEFDAA
jgi:formylglycine-generating enzyme required for sulfatase activity